MKILSTTTFRRNLSDFIRKVYEGNTTIVLGTHDTPRAILIKYPDTYQKEYSDIANMNAYSGAFAFLDEEPELYTKEDIREFYA